MSRPVRLLLLALGAGCLFAGLDAALLLLGLPAPVEHGSLPGLHGVLMVLGFLGTVIALERAVALRQPWGYLAPALLGAGGIVLLTPAHPVVGQVLLLNGMVVLVAGYAALWHRSRETTVLVQLLGAVVAACAAGLWLRLDMVDLVPWLAAFVVLTIAAERVELARIGVPGHAPQVLLALSTALVMTVLASLVWPVAGGRLFGLALLALVLWLVRIDVARRLIRSTGLPRFSAAALLAGYAWLAVAGITWVTVGAPASVPAYDVIVHGTFLGFAMSMVLAHAPVILPAVLHVRLPYRPVLWAPLGLLHAGMVVRVVGVTTQGAVWQAGSVATVAAILLLVATAFALVVTA